MKEIRLNFSGDMARDKTRFVAIKSQSSRAMSNNTQPAVKGTDVLFGDY